MVIAFRSNQLDAEMQKKWLGLSLRLQKYSAVDRLSPHKLLAVGAIAPFPHGVGPKMESDRQADPPNVPHVQGRSVSVINYTIDRFSESNLDCSRYVCPPADK